MEDKKIFNFFRSYYEAAKQIPDKEGQADFLMAVLAYGFDKEEPASLNGWTKAMFEVVRPNLDASDNKAEAGKQGAAKRWETQKQANGVPMAGQKQPNSTPIATQKQANGVPMAKKEEGERKKEEGERTENTPLKPPTGGMSKTQEQAFDQFWAAYPKKKSKGQAKKAWSKINPSRELFTAIMDRLQQLKNSYDWQKDGGRFIPYPASWLNAEGWNDEVGVSMPKRVCTPSGNPFLEMLSDIEQDELSIVDEEGGT